MEKVLVSSGKRRVVVPSPRPSAMREIQLIDRIKEMDVLRKAVDRAPHGEGGVIFLYGEAGIGKTRLARELGAYARSQGMQVLSGRCPALFRMDGVPPYILWEEVIKDYLEVCTPEQLFRVIGSYPVEVSKLVPELKQKLRAFPQSFPLSPEHSRHRLFEAVTHFITNISKETPLLVILDDLQWTDQSSLLLLHYLARGIYKESLLLLGAYRDSYVDKKHPLSPVLTELNRERLLQSVSLKRLPFDDVLEMIKRILEQDDISREFCQLVYQKTRGNPFFVEEVVKSLKEDEVIYREKNKWKVREVSKIEFPETVKDTIKARISRLDDECQRALTMASFVGRNFSFDVLKEVTGFEEDKLLETMEKMLETGLIKERVMRGEDVLSFADIIVRDVVYEEVSRLRRKMLHNLVGNALEKVYAEKIEKHFGELAYHFLEGGDNKKALEYFLKAGEKAQKIYAHDEAITYLQHALKLLETKKGNVEEKARITENLGDLKIWIGETDLGMVDWNESLILWNQLGDKTRASRLHVKMAEVYWSRIGDRRKASEHHRNALEILEKEPESVELARLYNDVSHMLWRSGKLTEAEPWTQKALRLAERLGDPKVLVGCYDNLGIFNFTSGDLEKSLEYRKKGLKITLENNLVQEAITFYINLWLDYSYAGEFQLRFETCKKGLELAKRVGDVSGLAWLAGEMAVAYIDMGEIRQAISMLEEVLASDKRTKNAAHISNTLINLGKCYLWLGEWKRSLQNLMEALDTAREAGESVRVAYAALQLGNLFMEKEDFLEAEKYFNESNMILGKENTTWQIAQLFPDLSRLYLRKGEIQKAKVLIEKTYKFATRTKSRVLIFHAEMLKAMLLRRQEKWEQSIQRFEKSLQEGKSLNAQKWYAHLFAELLYEYGSMYLGRNEKGDKEKAHSILSQALKIYKKMDARGKMEEIWSMIYPEAERQMFKPEPVAEVIVPEFITTGNKDLDDLLFGGIPREYAVILKSPSCDERDSLIKSFLETGVKEGQVTFHVVAKASGTESLAEDFQSNFYLFICNPEADAIIKSMPNVFKLKGVENLNDINIALASAFRKIDKAPTRTRRVCIEIVSDILLQHHTVQTRRWLNALIPKLKSEGFTTLAVMDPGMHSPQEVRAVLDLFEGEINLYEKETKKGSEKFLKIKKMYNRKYSKRELRLQEERLHK
jgi:adenylate cyclase